MGRIPAYTPSFRERNLMLVHRVLPEKSIATLDEYVRAGGGKGLEAARRVSPDVLMDVLDASGLRGRGGAGFPTGTKWRTVASFGSDALPTTVVVNAAEGEPGTFKDRSILMTDPYSVLEGALIAGVALGADEVIVATKSSFSDVMTRVAKAIEEITAAGWTVDCPARLVGGPDEYLFGEETALLEVIDGRPPLPRIAPPWRRGVVEVVDSAVDEQRDSGLAARVDMAGPTTDAPPALVSNVETFANVTRVITNGDEWLRTNGTTRSPGTVVCTVTGSTAKAGVGELPLGTPIADAINEIGGGLRTNRKVKAVLSGVSTGVLTGDQITTPLTYEDMTGAGGGLGSAGLIVLDDNVDMIAVAAGAAHFLWVESCGQCTPCKNDGKAIAISLARLCRNEGNEQDRADVRDRLTTVANGARCSLASQQQIVIGSILAKFDNEMSDHLAGRADPAEPMLIAALVDISGGEATLDEQFRAKQPDWTYDATDSGQSPTERLTDHTESLPEAPQ